MIAALFVDPKGAYADVPGVDLWDEARDARLYPGPHPVVAHPPCNRWVNMAGHNYIRYTRERGKPQPHLRPGNDGGCFLHALMSVLRWGGVLEHPAGSHAWETFLLPVPGTRSLGWRMVRPARDMWWSWLAHELWVCEVWQSAYGHPARKRTWLVYAGHKYPPELRWNLASGTHQVGWYDRNKPTLGKREASATPPAFRDVLIEMAQSAGREAA